MYTVCDNPECGQRYKIKPELLGKMARCKRCQNIFEVQEYKEPVKIIDLQCDEDDDTCQDQSTQPQTRKRRSPAEVMTENIAIIKAEVKELMPRLNTALDRGDNESDTRLLINKMLQRVLGYSLDDIKTEQKVEGKRADYVLSVNGEDCLIIEAKKIGMPLKQNQIFQATSYGAHSGIRWVILTNAIVWQLYHLSFGEKIETDLVFSIELRDGLDDDEAYYFYLLSKTGMARKQLLDKLWQKISALCYDNIVNAILTDDVISKIRATLSKQTGCRITNEELRASIENNILQLA